MNGASGSIDTNGMLHDRLGRFANQNQPAAGFDLAASAGQGVEPHPLVASGLYERCLVTELEPGQVNALGQTVASVEQVTGSSVKVTYANGDTAYYGSSVATVLVETGREPQVAPEALCAHGRQVPDCRCVKQRSCGPCIGAGCLDIPVPIHGAGDEFKRCLCCGVVTGRDLLCGGCQVDVDKHVKGDDTSGARERAIEAVRGLRADEKHDPYGRDSLVIDGTRFTRAREGVWPETPYRTRIEADRDLTEDEAQRLAQLFGYAYATTGGERVGDPTDRDTPRSLIFATDTTKGRAYERMDRFTAMLTDPEFVGGGSPVRKTDRAGVGTRGTRLIDGLGPNAPKIAVYYDSVWGD